MKEINFSEEWDKLKPVMRKTGNQFTTIRGYTPQKEPYYYGSIGELFHIKLKRKYIGVAKLIGVYIIRPSQMTIAELRVDTHSHYERKDIEKLFNSFYKNKDPLCLVLRLMWMEVYDEKDKEGN